MTRDEGYRRSDRKLLISAAVGVLTIGVAMLVGVVMLRHSVLGSAIVGYIAFATVQLVLRGLYPGHSAGSLEACTMFVLLFSIWLPSWSLGEKWLWTSGLVVLPAAGFALGRIYRLRHANTRTRDNSVS